MDVTMEERSATFYHATNVAGRTELNVSVLGKSTTAPGKATNTGLADLEAALKLGLGTTGVVRAAQVEVKLPTGTDAGDELPRGDGQVDLEGRLLLGASLWKLGLPLYTGLEAGYRLRGGEPDDVFVFLAELGAGISFKIES